MIDPLFCGMPKTTPLYVSWAGTISTSLNIMPCLINRATPPPVLPILGTLATLYSGIDIAPLSPSVTQVSDSATKSGCATDSSRISSVILELILLQLKCIIVYSLNSYGLSSLILHYLYQCIA